MLGRGGVKGEVVPGPLFFTFLFLHPSLSHVADYIEEKGLPLGRTSDQLIENTHCQTNRIFNRSHYYVKNLNSPAHKKKLGQGLNHYNSYNA